MYKLYGRPGSGSAVVEATLMETDAPYEVEYLPREGDGSVPASFAQINPMRQIPALILPDGTVMTESGSILIYLADGMPQANLAPRSDSPKRAAYLRWMLFLAVNIYMSAIRVTYPARYTGDAHGAGAVKKSALDQMAKEWEVYAAALGQGPFILGNDMNTADLYAAMLATWNEDVPAFFQRHPNVKAMYERVLSRPKIAAAWKKNKMEWWVQA